MQLSPTEFARRGVNGVYRDAAARLTLPILPVVTRDGHTLTAEVQASVLLVPRDADRALFDEQFPGPLVTLDGVRQHVAPRLADAARVFAQQHDAQQCLDGRGAFAQLVLARLNEIGFACGLEFLPPLDVSLHCASLEAQRAAARVSAERLDALGRAADVIAKVKAGDADALLPRDRGTALQLLLKQAPAQAAYVVAGPKLLRLTGGDAAPEAAAIEIDLGPLRSIRRAPVDGGERLVVGGQRGVALIGDPAGPPAVYRLATASDRGFNSAAIDSHTRTLYAAHSEIGIARWNLDSAETMSPLAAPAAARWLTPLDERVLFAAGGAVCVADAGGVRTVAEGAGPIVGLHVLPEAVVVVRAGGTIEQLDRATLRPMTTARREGGFAVSAVVAAGGITALAVAAADVPIDVVSLAGELLLELHGLAGVRMLACAGGRIFAVAADRQRVAVWQADRPEKPARVHAITAMVQHRVADIT
jgi:hypothetical protein